MVLDLSKINGIENYDAKVDINIKPGKPTKKRTLYYCDKKVFLVENENTLEIRTDEKLGHHLKEKYESVMESRYFGKNGIEIVPAGQLTEAEIKDLIRLSYDLTVQKSA